MPAICVTCGKPAVGKCDMVSPMGLPLTPSAAFRLIDATMTPKQYKAIIDDLGLTQEGAGEWLGVSGRTGQNYAANGPPEPVAKLLRLCVKLKLKPEDVK